MAGRPSKYKPEYAEQAYKLCLLGAKDKEIADFFGVDEATINRWKDRYPEFCESLKAGKEDADAKVAQSLYHRAIGYEHPEIITATFKGKITDTMEVVKHYPPDPTAAIFWLKNRQSAKWRDRQEIEHSGETKHTISHDLSGLSAQELSQLESILSKTENGEKTS